MLWAYRANDGFWDQSIGDYYLDYHEDRGFAKVFY